MLLNTPHVFGSHLRSRIGDSLLLTSKYAALGHRSDEAILRKMRSHCSNAHEGYVRHPIYWCLLCCSFEDDIVKQFVEFVLGLPWSCILLVYNPRGTVG